MPDNRADQALAEINAREGRHTGTPQPVGVFDCQLYAVFYKNEPMWDSIHNTPRLTELIRRMGIP